MKRTTIITVSLSILAVALVLISIFLRQSGSSMKTKELSLEAALKEMPLISVSAEETSFMESLKQDGSVKTAIESGQITDLPVEKAAELARGIFPSDIKVGEFSVFNKTVCFGYFTDDCRVILEIFTDGRIHKTIGVYSKDGNVKTVYENYNNTAFLKSTL